MNRYTEIRKLASKLFTKTKGYSYNCSGNIKNQLVSMGAQIVTPVLDEIFHRHEANELFGSEGLALYHLICAIEDFAEKHHANLIAQILTWEEVVAEEDRSTRGHLLRILANIGNQETVPTLEAFKKQVVSVPYKGRGTVVLEEGDIPPATIPQLRRLDQEAIDETIRACRG